MLCSNIDARSRIVLTPALILLLVTSAAIAQPTVSSSPLTQHPSGILNISGSGFSGSEAVDIFFDTTDVTLGVSNTVGHFGSYALTVPASASPGTHWITAIGRRDGMAAQKAITVGTNWSQLGFETKGKRFNSYENVLNTTNLAEGLDLKWEAGTSGAVRSSAAVANGTVYVGSDDGRVYAFDAATGKGLWFAITGGGRSSPAVANGIVYVGGNANKFYAFNAGTGALLWAAGPIGTPFSASPVIANGLVYTATAAGAVYAFNAQTGATVWNSQMGGTTSASPIVDNGVVYIGSDDSNFYAFNAGTGANLWSRPFGAPIQVTAAAAGGQIFVPTSDGKIWSIGPNGGSGVGLNLSTGGCSAPAVAYGLIFLSCADNRLYAIKSSWYNTTSTPIAWYINDSGGTGSSPAVADGAVFVGTHGATLALNATTGELLSGLLLLNSSSDAIESSPAVSDGVVYFGADDGYFYAFAMDPGPQAMQLGNKQAPSPKTLRPDLTLKPGKLSTGNDGG